MGGGGGEGGRDDVRSWEDLVASRPLETGTTPALLNRFFFSAAPGDEPFLGGVNGWVLSGICIPSLLPIVKGILGFTSWQGDTKVGFCFQVAPAYYLLVKSSFNGW